MSEPGLEKAEVFLKLNNLAASYGSHEDFSDQVEGQPSKHPYRPLVEVPSAPSAEPFDKKNNNNHDPYDLSYDDFEAKLVEFYEQHNKSKLPDVPRLAMEYVTKQEECWDILLQKYPDVPRKKAQKPPPHPIQLKENDRKVEEKKVEDKKEDRKVEDQKDLKVIPEPGLLKFKSTEQVEILYRARFHWTKRFRYCWPNPCGFLFYPEIHEREYLWVMENRIEENNPNFVCCCYGLRDNVTVVYFDQRSDVVREPCCTPYHCCCCTDACGGVAAWAPCSCVNNICCPCCRHHYPCLIYSGEFVQIANSARAQFPLQQNMC